MVLNVENSVYATETETQSVFQRINSLLPSSLRRRKLSLRKSGDKKKLKREEGRIKRTRTIAYGENRCKGAQHDPHHTRDAQLRRRSSWSDLSSFFKFNKGARQPEDSGSEHQSPVNGCSASKTQSTSTLSNVAGSNKTSNAASYGGKAPAKNSRTQGLSRSPSLRINSNGNVVTSSSKHRRVSNNMHLLQYDSINKGSSVRYQQGKPNMSKSQYPNSAPATPKGSHAGGLLPPIRPDYRGQNPSSPVTRRSPNSQQNTHRRPSPHSVPPSFAVSEQNIRDHNYANQSSKQYNNDPRSDNRLDYQPHETTRFRSASDPRKHQNHPHSGQQHAGQSHTGQQHAGQSHQGRQELSKENLDTFNCYGNAPYEPSGTVSLQRSHSARIARNVQQDNGGMVPIHMDNRYVIPPHGQDHHVYEQRSPHAHDIRQPFPPPNIESNFRPVESYSREIQAAHHPGDRFEHDYRVGNPEFSTSHVAPAAKHGTSYRNQPHELTQSNDPKLMGRDMFQTNKNNNNANTQKVDPRLVGPQLLRANPQTHNAGSGRYSPNHTVDNELINGSPSRQYYDSMISQISNQIARVSEGGASSQQPFNTVLQKAAPPPVDDDDNEWC